MHTHASDPLGRELKCKSCRCDGAIRTSEVGDGFRASAMHHWLQGLGGRRSHPRSFAPGPTGIHLIDRFTASEDSLLIPRSPGSSSELLGILLPTCSRDEHPPTPDYQTSMYSHPPLNPGSLLFTSADSLNEFNHEP